MYQYHTDKELEIINLKNLLANKNREVLEMNKANKSLYVQCANLKLKIANLKG